MSGEVDTISFKFKRHRPSSLNLSNMALNKLSSEKSNKPIGKTTGKSSSTADDKITTPKVIEPDNSSTIKSVQLEYNKDNTDVALRLVSPGLPRLSDEMKNTIKLSHKIHIQQKHIIEARISGNNKDDKKNVGSVNSDNVNEQENESSENTDEPDHTDELDNETSDKSADEESTEVLNTESSSADNQDTIKSISETLSRGLKRKHVPTPLSIDQSMPAPNPLIQSAPLFSKLKFNNSKKFQTTPVAKTFNTYLTPHKASPYNQVNKKVRIMSQGHISYPITSTSPYFTRSKPHYQQFTPQPTAGFNRAYPPFYPPAYYASPSTVINHPTDKSVSNDKTVSNDKSKLQEPTTASQTNKPAFNPRLEAQLHSLGIPTEARKVVDVFHGDLIKDAPIQSQPLSSQREFFDHTPTNLRKFIEDDRSPVSEEEIREMQEKYASNMPHYSHLPSGIQPVPLGLNPIIAPGQHYPTPVFVPRSQIQTQDKPNEIFGSIQFMNEKFFNFKIFDDESSDTQREKFLRLCENTWDEFISKKSKTEK